MKRIISLFCLLAIGCLAVAAPKKAKLPEVVFEWGQPQILGPGGYPRVHHLQDGRLMCVYGAGNSAWVQYSSDGGDSWTQRQLVLGQFEIQNENGSTAVMISNSESAQLSRNNPYHPGRIIYAVNLRPKGDKSTVFPYSIAYVTSDDNGVTWSPMNINFQSDGWDVDTAKGCWEPYVQELPDGKVQMYFSDETPYYRDGNKYQNISVIESTDGGDSWSAPRVVCYSAGNRDGMPVTMIYDGKIYLSIESNRPGIRLHPQVLYTTLEDNWSVTVDEFSDFRFDPFLTSLESPDYTTGAPYLIETENFLVISYQSSENGDIKVSRQRIMEVQACPKSEVKKNIFTTMRGASHPIDVDPTQSSVKWNSLCPLNGDELIACCQYDGKVAIVKGRVKLDIRE